MNNLDSVVDDVDELTDAMASADVLDTFLQLPFDDQQRFWRWIGQARDEESCWRRTNALVLALRFGPLSPARPERQRGSVPKEQL